MQRSPQNFFQYHSEQCIPWMAGMVMFIIKILNEVSPSAFPLKHVVKISCQPVTKTSIDDLQALSNLKDSGFV